MSCRTTPAGSLATTFIQRRFGLEDGQCTSLFHELRREAEARSPEEIHNSLDSYVYSEAIASMAQDIQDRPEWSDAMRARALARVTNAVAAGNPSSDIMYAVGNITRRARHASASLTSLLQGLAATYEITPAQIKGEFRRLYNEYDRSFQGREELFFRNIANIPSDQATAYALGVITNDARCTSCGRFLGAAAHVCPSDATQHLPLVSQNVSLSDFFNSTNGPSEITLDVPAVAPTEIPAMDTSLPVREPVVVEPWDMEAFQAVYDEVRERSRSGDYRVPAFENPGPGEVTGGLGARNGGNSFGIELEIDFPDDNWPYNARQRFAEILHNEGIVRSPEVERWHFVGDQRPGGDYVESNNDWVCEFDRSVDDVDGERGVEIKSQILYDEPETWENLAVILDVAKELGGKPTMRTGLHVNVGGASFPSDDPSAHNALLRIAGAYDDTLIRLAHNPLSGPVHRGRGYCGYAWMPPEGFDNVAHARSYSNHYQAFNLGHLPSAGERHRRSSRIEVRLWDSTLDLGRIQTAVTSSLAVVKLALLGAEPGQGPERAGTHRDTFGTSRLSGEEWELSTQSFRRFVTLLGAAGANTETHRKALTSMFAASRWQSN